MEGITYPEHLAPGVSLDSRFSTGMLQVKPLPLLVHKNSLIARPQVAIKTSHWKPVINPVIYINTEFLHVKKFPYPAPLEQSVLGVLPEYMDGRDGWIKVSQSHNTVILRTFRLAVIGTDDVRNGDC